MVAWRWRQVGEIIRCRESCDVRRCWHKMMKFRCKTFYFRRRYRKFPWGRKRSPYRHALGYANSSGKVKTSNGFCRFEDFLFCLAFPEFAAFFLAPHHYIFELILFSVLFRYFVERQVTKKNARLFSLSWTKRSPHISSIWARKKLELDLWGNTNEARTHGPFVLKI